MSLMDIVKITAATIFLLWAFFGFIVKFIWGVGSFVWIVVALFQSP